MHLETPSDFLFTDAEVVKLHELPQKLFQLAQHYRTLEPTSLLIEVSFDELQKFQSNSNTGLLWSFELLLQSLRASDLRDSLTTQNIADLQVFLDAIKSLANNMLEARAYALVMLEGIVTNER